MSPPASPLLDSLRRQLEGRWERIEEARERYTQLTRQLDSFQWKRVLRGQPELLRETREQEAELTEVLAYVEHRAGQEQWPREHPGRRVLQELRALRAKLEALAHRRLSPSLLQAASFVEALGELERLVLAPLPQLPGVKDPVLFEGWMFSWPAPGRVWLTPQRLLWQPWSGEPVQLPLAPLERDAVPLLPGWLGVRVKKLGLTLFSFSARALAALLQLSLRTVHLWREQPQVSDVVTSLAYCRHVDHVAPEHWGLAVFGPHGLALLPTRHRTLLDLCRSLVSIDARRPHSSELRRLESLVEELRRLPPDEFSPVLRELTRARGGKFWSSDELHLLAPPGQDVRLQAGKYLVVAQGQDAIDQLLERHPPSVAGFPKSSWRLKRLDKMGILTGLLLFYAPILSADSFGPVSLAGYALFTWACVHYTTARGYSALIGLGISLLSVFSPCMPLALFVFGLTPRDEPRLPPKNTRA